MKQLLQKFSGHTLLLAGLLVLAGIVSFGGVLAMTPSEAKQVSAASTGCQGICVDLRTDGMSPDALAIEVGEYVQFNSKDGKAHNISLGEGAHKAKQGDEGHEHEAHDAAPHEHSGSYSSGDFGADEAWRVQFKQAGTYTLHDHYNPKLYITVVVYQSGADTTIR